MSQRKPRTNTAPDTNAAFNASPALTLANQELQGASQSYQSIYDAAFLWLRGSIEYADLYDGVDEMNDQVQQQRNLVPLKPGVLAATSNAWMNSLNALSKFRDDYLSRDPGLIAANQRLQTAQASRKALIDRFNAEISTDPQLKRLLDAAADEKSNLAGAAKEMNTANESRATSESAIAQLQTAIANERATLAAAQRDVASLGASADSSSYNVTLAQAELDRLCNAYALAQSDSQRAAGELRRTIEVADSDHAHREGRGPLRRSSSARWAARVVPPAARPAGDRGQRQSTGPHRDRAQRPR